ncbi:flagellar hook-associated protein FlgL [Desulforamulus ruminis]|uniref:Flagellar hook-associated protein 3 n=1 Tax=Desulforamulus ruminis (strain ATCC 23193 / DSM 2154 / NCIMB 8452 / DL) TaxID=696281 RepID=F6DNP2_DESRL|nr:flagellar hook-associated protein FlgL [Desulforamulus ruminis]AEG59487.1 flagellar hook-associated protein 3 [Desulforamulus ruminis DSM 2154]
MRITSQYVTNSMIRYVQTNLSNLAISQEQIATTKRVNRPSDDPNILSPLLAIKGNLAYNEQYSRNLDDGLAYLDVSDSTMGSMGDVLKKAYEYAEQAANDTYSSDQRKAVAVQIDKLIDQMVDFGNAAVGSKYVFAGKENSNPPFKRITDADGKECIIFMGDTEKVEREVAAHTSYPINATSAGFGVDGLGNPVPEGAFGWARDDAMQTISGVTGQVLYKEGGADGDFSGLFKELFELKNALNDDSDPDQQQKIEVSIGDLQEVMDRVLQHRVAVGSRYNQFEDMKKQLLNQNISLEGTMSTLEDADMSKLSILVAQQMLTYQASLAVGTNMLKTSLLDYLR